ncbi:hypothetical protein OKA05_02000 [Luteolibacter arcticus]|uniref:BT4734-like N-terminal domain-containing protein n=1 Tax=Luteolibacter arcticus TaxID=1581411 RepID=A0ABT3GDC8_9BACT|nr:BT4734/BF3469 family protein [Luteolibacter arcticus]MCW1921305.1 hypothetical protein [Luteolibacter arcticus]
MSIPIKELLAGRKAPPKSFNPSIDYYNSAKAKSPRGVTTLRDFFEAVRSDEYAESVSKIRECIAHGVDPGELKKALPAVSISGTVTTGGRSGAATEGRFQHSGLLQIDLDGKDNPNWSLGAMREALMADPHVVSVLTSASGTGVKGFARISPDVDLHLGSFLAAERHFTAVGLVIDKACKDPVRLCFVSHDPDAWFRDDEARILEPLTEADVENGDGLILHETGPRPPTLHDLESMLSCIPKGMHYDEWNKILSAAFAQFGESAIPYLEAWDMRKPGEMPYKLKTRMKDFGFGTLVMRAKENGWAPTVESSIAPRSPKTPAAPSKPEAKSSDKSLIPPHVFPIPANEIGHDLAARHIFSVIGPTNRLFMRGVTAHEVAQEPAGDFTLLPVNPERFVSMLETFGKRVMRREVREDGIVRWRSTVFPAASAKVALLTDAAREVLPTIRQLVNAPVIIPKGESGVEVIGKGYHPHAGGTFITSGHVPDEVPLEEAKRLLMMTLEDFDFPAGGDASRAVASMISPAMKIGGWIEDDFPLDIAEADQSQSGKTYRQKMICAIYRESPSAITQAAGGVGSLDERVSTALITGRPFISFDNFRGRMDSQILETAIRGLGKVSARALRVAADIDCTPFLWQLSTNGAELTRDLANRSIITRIRKRDDSHSFKVYPEGDILAHIRHNQPLFLGAVQAVIREWVTRGRLMTTECRHDFRVWCRCMDWIVQNIFDLPPLLDGHREEQMRTANPKLQWVREIINAIVADGYGGEHLSASDLWDAAEEHDIPLPGRQASNEAGEVRVGKLLARLFKESNGDAITVDGRILERETVTEYEPITRNRRERRMYRISDV